MYDTIGFVTNSERLWDCNGDFYGLTKLVISSNNYTYYQITLSRQLKYNYNSNLITPRL